MPSRLARTEWGESKGLKMLKLLFKLFFWVVVARWGYAEIQLSAPALVPYVDYTLTVVQIPTHDRWPKESIKAAIGTSIAAISSSASGVHDEQVALKDEPSSSLFDRF